jgi:hypothetical protein
MRVSGVLLALISFLCSIQFFWGVQIVSYLPAPVVRAASFLPSYAPSVGLTVPPAVKVGIVVAVAGVVQVVLLIRQAPNPEDEQDSLR